MSNKPENKLQDAWHDDPANWKWGIFYYNRLDKRILPPKRYQGMGWTVNFANPFSYLAFLGFMVIVVVILYFFS